MKKFLLILLLAFTAKNYAQFGFLNNYYFNCLESSYQLEYGIVLSSPKGNYEKAQALLNTAYFKSNPEKALLIKALFTYNTQGKNTAFGLIDASDSSIEIKDFSKLWLSFHAKNTSDYAVQLKDFEKNHPQNYDIFKLKFRKLIDYRDSNLWNSIYKEKQKALQSIDSLVGLGSTNKDDKIFFSLIKLDFLAHEEKDRNEGKEDVVYSKEKLLHQLLILWKQDKTLFNPSHLQKMIGDCKSSDCKEALQYIESELNKNNSQSSTEKVYALLMNKDEKQSVSEMERKITDIITREKNEEQLSKIKALLTVFSLSKEPDLGFFMKGLLKPIPFSKEFRLRYAAPQNKTVVLGKINALFEGAEFPELKANIAKDARFREEMETIKSLSAEDLQAVYGMMLFSGYYAKSLKGLGETFGSFSDGPSAEEKKDFKKYIAFLEKNPLYYDSSKYKFNLVQLNSEADVMAFIKETQKLKEKYPGSAAILDNCIYAIAFSNKLITEKEQQHYYLDYFKLVVDVLKVKFSGSTKEENDSNYFGPILNYDSKSPSSYFEDFYDKLSADAKNEAQEYLQKAIAEYPDHKDFNYLKRYIDKKK